MSFIGSIFATMPPLVAARDVEEFVTELRWAPEGWWGLGLALLLLFLLWAVAWMYRHEGRAGATTRARMAMAVVRCLVLVILAVILLEPVRVRILRQWIDSYTIVLMDDSASMGLADAYRNEEEAARVRGVLGEGAALPARRVDVTEPLLRREDHRFLRELADRNRVRVFRFGDEAELIGAIPAAWERGRPGEDGSKEDSSADSVDPMSWKPAAADSTTNVERAVRRSVESLGGAPIAAVVVVSDGGFNRGAGPEEVGRFARERRIPIHVVGVGDPARPRNVRVADVLAPENAFQNDPFAVTATLHAQGLEGEAVRVALRERDAAQGGDSTVVDSRSVILGPDGPAGEVRFERKQDRTGRFSYVIEVEPVEGEAVLDDNAGQTAVNVLDSRTRVLLVSSMPSWEYRYVSRLLQRDDTFELSCWLQSADLAAVRDGDVIIDHLPRQADELFDYDVILLMDPDPSELDGDWARLMDTFVARNGGGVLFAAARTHASAFMRAEDLKPLRDMLPIVPDPDVDLVLNQIGHYQLSSQPVEIPGTSFSHPVLRMGDDAAASRLAWSGVGDVHWHYPVLREKPAATVLMRHGDARMRNSHGGHVLAAAQYVGAGRTAFLAIDGTWRWRREGVEMFDRFWVQLIRHLSEGRLLGGGKRGAILTEADRFHPGDAVNVTARLMDERYEPLERDEVEARVVVDADPRSFSLRPRSGQPGWYEGRVVVDKIGEHRITIELPGVEAGESQEISKEILVTRPDLEILKPQMDRAALTALAENSMGGRYFHVDEAGALPDLVPDLHEEVPVRSRPTTLWDRWQTLALLVGLLSVEWALRKWHHLL